MRFASLLAALVCAALAVSPALAQQSSLVTILNGTSPVGSANPLPLSLNGAQAAVGIIPNNTPYGTLNVSVEPSTLFFDPFDGGTVDTTNRWTLSGTNTPTQSSGSMTLSLPATINLSSVAVSQPSFAPSVGYLLGGLGVTLETAQQSNPNVHRFWGFGQVTSYTYATPLTDGAGFEVDGTGALNCVIYVAGTRYVVNSTNTALITPQVSLPTGGVTSTFGQTIAWQGPQRIYAVVVRPDAVFFYIGNLKIPVGVAQYVNPAVYTLPWRNAAVTNSAAVLSSTFVLSAQGVADSSAQNITVSDPTSPWRRQTVDSTGSAKVSATPYPIATTVLTGASGTVANAVATATLTAAAGLTTYLCGYDITSTGATAAAVVAPTITGLTGGTQTLTLAAVAGVTTQNATITREFTPCIPASAANTAIAVVVPALGAGATNVTVNAHGFRQ